MCVLRDAQGKSRSDTSQAPAQDAVVPELGMISSPNFLDLSYTAVENFQLFLKDDKMRIITKLLAEATAASTGGPLRSAPMALLPPIPLYRRLLRAHRKLPAEMRILGDEYVGSEFRAHRNVENPVHIVSLRFLEC